MRFHELARLVQHRARIATPVAAERATRAALETLSTRVPDALASTLSARLPTEMGNMVRRQRDTRSGPPGDDFVATLAERARLDAPRAAAVARTVLSALDAATSGALGSARTNLAEDVRDLTPAPRSRTRVGSER